MRLARLLIAWTLAAWVGGLAWAAPPAAKAGPYTVTVERVARTLDLSAPGQPQASLVVTVSVGAEDPAQLERLVEVARDAAARDEFLGVLKFRQVRLLPDARSRRAEVVFSAASPMADSLRLFSGSLVSSKKTESLRLEAPAAPEGTARDASGAVAIVVDGLELGRDERGRPAQIVRFTIRLAPGTAGLPRRNEQIILTDDRGLAHAALSETRTYQYADQGQRLTAVKVTAFFAPLTEGCRPRALRYLLDRVVGVEVLAYQFRNLPLP